MTPENFIISEDFESASEYTILFVILIKHKGIEMSSDGYVGIGIELIWDLILSGLPIQKIKKNYFKSFMKK